MSLKDFTHMVLPYKNKLYRHALRILGNMPEAEDVVQEVFIKMWKNKDQWEQYNNIEAWCMRMTRNLSIDKLRSKHKKLDQLPENVEFKSHLVTPDHQAELQDTMSQIETLVAALPEKQRMIFQLRDIDEMSYQEIADTLDIPMDQVKVNLFRARKKIRVQLLKAQSYGL